MRIKSTLLLSTTLSALLIVASAIVTVNNEVHSAADNDRDSPSHAIARHWSVQFEYQKLNMTMTHTQTVVLIINGIPASWRRDFHVHIKQDDDAVASIDQVKTKISTAKDATIMIKGNFTINAKLLGYTRVRVELRRSSKDGDAADLSSYEPEISHESMLIIVTRALTVLDTIFNITLACFVMVIYINFGAVLDLVTLKEIILCPVGPAIGLFCQYVVMPVLSFSIGYFLFHDMIELRLGLFFLGVSPAGGSSNVFAVLLNGNLSLSITMTAITNLAAFGMMPMWIFTLGALIFRDGNFVIPYKAIASISCTLVIPIAIGVMLQKYAPQMAKTFAKLLKPLSLILIVAITVFACLVNSYMFKLFTPKLLIGSCILPWLGYILGWLIATLLGQSRKDAITIAIETGIQNIGIAVFMLSFTLPQPQADMTCAVPVANSLVTPLPLLLIYFLRMCFYHKCGETEEEEKSPTKGMKEFEMVAIMEEREREGESVKYRS